MSNIYDSMKGECLRPELQTEVGGSYYDLQKTHLYDPPSMVTPAAPVRGWPTGSHITSIALVVH